MDTFDYVQHALRCNNNCALTRRDTSNLPTNNESENAARHDTNMGNQNMSDVQAAFPSCKKKKKLTRD